MMTLPTSLISARSERYTDAMCGDNRECMFNRSCIAAAYIVGAIETRQRMINIINSVAKCSDGISPEVDNRMLLAIQHIESLK